MEKKQIIIFTLIIVIIIVSFLIVILYQKDVDRTSDTNRNKDGKTKIVKQYYDFTEFEKSPASPTVCNDKKTLFYLLNCECQYFDLVDVSYQVSTGYMSEKDAKESGIDNKYTTLVAKLKIDEKNIETNSYFSEKQGLPPLLILDKLELLGIDISKIKSTGINFKDFNIDLKKDILCIPYEIYWMTVDRVTTSDFNVLIYATIPYALELNVQSVLNSEQ